MIEDLSGYICYLVDKDGVTYHKKSIVSNYQMQRLPFSLMSSLSLNGDVELFERHNMKEIYGHGDFNCDHVNVKVTCESYFFMTVKSGLSKLF